MRRRHDDPTPEMEDALIRVWHSFVARKVIRESLGISDSYLEAMWARFRKAGKLPLARRPGSMKGRPQGERTVEETDEMAAERRKTSSTRLLDALRLHHGCTEAYCGRQDIPPALLKVQRKQFFPKFVPKRVGV